MSDENREQLHDAENAAGVAVEREFAPSKTQPKKLPPFKLLLHNDDENTFERVVLAIIKLTGLTTEDAIERTMEAHETGVSLLLTTHRERAELYQEQFLTYQITTTIEPA